MVLKRKFRGFSRRESPAGKAFNGSLTLIDMVKYGDIKGLKRLLGRSDTNLEETNETGETALILAAMLGDCEALQLLVESGADLNAKSMLNTTALMAAAQNGDLTALRYLLSKGADLNARKKDETTILMLASMLGHEDCVEALLEAGVFVTAEDIYGYTALMLAGNKECAALLSAAEAKEIQGINTGHKHKDLAHSPHRKKLKKVLSTVGRKRGKSRRSSHREKPAREKPSTVPPH